MQSLKRVFTPDRTVTAVGGALVGILTNVVSEYFTGGWLLAGLVAILLLIGLAYLALQVRHLPRTLVKIGAPMPLSDEQTARRYARKGLIAFVPPYQPVKNAAYRRLGPRRQAEFLQRARQSAGQGVYQGLDFELSNLGTVITAATAHRSALQHCWLIATSGERGSADFIPALVNYLRQEKGLTCEFHTDGYQLEVQRNDTEVVEDARALVEQIFTEAHALKLQDTDMLADITAGLRSLSLGMTLACLDQARDLQFVGTTYGPDGRPAGEPLPAIYHFETKQVD